METQNIYSLFDKNLNRIAEVRPLTEWEIDPSTLTSGTLVGTLGQDVGNIGTGKKGFTNDETGYILGLDEGTPKFYIGTSSSYLNFDGSTTTISGTLITSSATIGGWTVNATSIYTGTEDHSGYTTNAGDLTIYSDGSDASIHAKNFYIDTTGTLTAAGVVITGSSSDLTITGGALSGVTLDIGGADATSFHCDVNGNIWLGAATYNIATNPFAVSNAGILRAVSGTIGGWTLGATTLTGTGVTLSSTGDAYLAFGTTPPISPTVGTGLFIDKTGLFGLNANTQNFKIDATNGNITSIAGTIGGFTLSATALYAGATTTRIQLDTTSGIHLGATAFADAPFRVSLAGALVATSATITGSITASSGSIGSFTIGTYLYTGSKTAYNDANAGVHLGSDGIGIANNLFTVSSAGVLTAVSGTVGGCTLATTSIGSTTFVSGPLGSGWNISNTGTAEFQNAIVRGVIRTSVFEKDTISAVNGIVLVSSADVLSVDMTAADDSTITISGQTTFSANEVIRIKDGLIADGQNDEWMLVTSAVAAPTYTVTRDLAGSYGAGANPIWKIGTTVVSMGVGTGTKTGFILLDSSSTNSPYIDVYGRNSNTYTDYTLHGRFGWLKGITDADVGLSTTDVWGLYTDNAYIKGVIVANTGKIGGATGWVITSENIKDTAGVVGMSSTVTVGDDIRFWAGHTTPASAPFKVTRAGALTATSATISGSITSTSGTIGGFTLATNTLSSGTDADYVGMSSDGTNAFWAGDSTFADAEFSVTAAGVLKATSATITGAITASSGSVGSFTIGTYLYTGSKTAYNDTNAGVHLGSDGIGIGNNIFTVSSAGALVATSATISGAITASTIDIGTNAWHVDTSGNMWWGSSATYAGATIKISSAGSVDLTTGNFSGTLSSGISITSPTITGGTIQTDAGATAGIKMDSTSLRGYDASNNITFELTRATGAVKAISGEFQEPLITTQLTAGEDITAGDAVALDVTDNVNAIFKAYSENPINCFGFVGIAAEDITSGNTGKVYLPGSIISYSGTLGQSYTLSNGQSTLTCGNNTNITDLYGANFVAGRFYVNDISYVTGLNFLVERTGNPGSFTVYIVKDGGAGTAPADMTVASNILFQQTFTEAYVAVAETTVYCQFGRMIKSSGSIMWVVVAAPSGGVANYISWRRSNATVSANEGENTSTDSGETWVGYDGAKDHKFSLTYLTSSNTPGILNAGVGATAVNVKVVGKVVATNKLQIERSPNVYVLYPKWPVVVDTNIQFITGFLPTKITFFGTVIPAGKYHSQGILHSLTKSIVAYSNNASATTATPTLARFTDGTIAWQNTESIKVDTLAKNYFQVDLSSINVVSSTSDVFIVEG